MDGTNYVTYVDYVVLTSKHKLYVLVVGSIQNASWTENMQVIALCVEWKQSSLVGKNIGKSSEV